MQTILNYSYTLFPWIPWLLWDSLTADVLSTWANTSSVLAEIGLNINIQVQNTDHFLIKLCSVCSLKICGMW